MPAAEDKVVDVQELDRENGAGDAVVESEEAPIEGADATADTTDADWFAKVESVLGELPAEASAEVVQKITAKDFQRLGQAERGLVKHVVAQARAEVAREKAALATEKAALEARAKELDAAGLAVLDERARFGGLIKSPEVLKMLEEAAKTDPTKLDLLTPEGQAKFLQKQAAEGLKTVFNPILNAAERAEKEKNLRTFLQEHPRMQDAAFKKQVVELGKAREAAGKPISLADAHALIEAKVIREEHAARVQAEQRARAAASKHVNKATRSGSAAEPPIPVDLEKKGYRARDGQVYRGTQATLHYFQDHPDKAKEYVRSKGR